MRTHIIADHAKSANSIDFRFIQFPQRSDATSPWNWFIQTSANHISYPLEGVAMCSPSQRITHAIAKYSSYPTNSPLQSSQRLRSTRHGPNGKVDTRSRSFALTVARNTWTRWLSMSNPSALNTILPLHILHNQTASQRESTALFSTWYVPC